MRFFCIILLFIGISSSLRGESGVAVIDSQSGQVTATLAGKELPVGKAFDPVGTDIQTGADGFSALVFSNGVAVYIAPNSHLQISHYEQTPFKARPDDVEFEPSRSTLRTSLLNGQVGVAQRDPNPLSAFTIELNEGVSVSLKAQSATVIHETLSGIMAIFDGRGSIQVGEQNHILSEGYSFVASLSVSSEEHIKPLTNKQREEWEPLAKLASIALRRWYFQTPEDGVILPSRITTSSIHSSKPYNNTKL
ncbi:hypothetical protein [Cerasicoccus arenae]|uniref:FecR protein domain-containing protein n=1 Tax=Cerasicoccus arenae TaxID=424488 RepID=A0A8J3DAB7_9BACT|nr:hypothetical protein [Cerasicoccus arenae]MBK1859002.1 hypothetical protein [Cerasicoccus arenae]GHB94624.1 hypothetical protein GCM10007047_07670 [Cerasicoccus arenae]